MSFFKSLGSDGELVDAKAGDANLNEFNFFFADMGQGDCTVISCPDNKVFIVDCGSTAELNDDEFEKTKKLVRKWADGNYVNLIMTHPDQDHYNKYLELLVPSPKVKVNVIYFSQAYSDKSPLGKYKVTAMGRNLGILGNPLLTEVIINKSKSEVRKWSKALGYNTPITSTCPDSGYVVASGQTAKGKDWSLSIIAGNVKSSSRSASQVSNCGSLVTLSQLGYEKMLLTGDSTTETLSFLLKYQEDNIKNVSYYQMPHHGSDGSLPPKGFVDLVDPESVIISVGLLNNTFNLPRFDAIDAWYVGQRIRKSKWVIDYWKSGLPDYKKHADLQNILTTNWKNYKYKNNGSGTFFWLKDPNDAKPSGTGFYGFTYDGFFIYRETIDKDIFSTSTEGSTSGGFK